MQQRLVGRDEELARVRAWLRARLDPAAHASGPPALFLTGEAGVGKTALLRALPSTGVAVRPAAATAWQPTPYGVLRQVCPEVGGGERVAAVDPAGVRGALLGSGEPVLVILDDLHWSDDATLDLLPALVDAVRDDRVAILAAYRGDELPRGHLLRAVRGQLRHRHQVTEVALGPLAADPLRELIAAALGAEPTPRLIAAVAERTEGLPFFVEELLAALTTADWLVPRGSRIDLAPGNDLPLPESVRDAVLLRVSRLSAASREAIDVAAVAGVEFDVATVSGLTGDGGRYDWPDEIDHSGLIVGDGERRRFRHVLLQEAVYSEVPWSHRRRLHRALAARLADTPVLAARHLLAAHDPERARPALLAAADEHFRAYALRDAARLLALALETWPSGSDEGGRLAAVDRLSRCAELSGDHAGAVTGLRELADRVREPAGRAEVHRRLAVQYELLGHWPPALAAREESAVAYAEAGDLGQAATEYLAIAAHLRSAASFRAALDTLDLAEPAAQAAARPDLACRITGLRGNVLARTGRHTEGIATVQSALSAALGQGLPGPAAEIYQRLADSLEHAGDYPGAAQAYDAAFEFCETHGQGATGQLCRACATVVLFQGGRWDRAVALCDEVLADATATAHARAVVFGVIGLVRAMRGSFGPARAALHESRTVARRIDLVAMELLSVWGLALVDEGTNRPEPALESYRYIVARCQQTEERHYCVPALQFAVARFGHQGAVADIAAATAVLADAAARTGQPEARAALLYALGETAFAASGPEAALADLRRAIELLDGLDLPIAGTLVRHRTASVLAAAGAREEAVELLRLAHGVAQTLKARVLDEPIRADLDRIGASRSVAPHGLSPREAQVMSLVGEGLTSPEIGRRLFLSVRTVDMHVRNSIAKLGCRTRAEAVRRLASMPTSSRDGVVGETAS